jgi:creatinine amidohydrolase/Fe(II)-dependent formamide hydrolase-like protein
MPYGIELVYWSFQGAISANDTYLGNMVTDSGSAGASGVREAVLLLQYIL